MNKDKRNNIQLLGTLNNSDESGIIANANQVYDANEDKSTQDVSKEHKERIETLETKENSMQTTLENITKTGEASAASNVTYNHNDSKLDATNVQQAVDEVRKRSNYNDGENIIDFNTIHLITDNSEFICAAVDANARILYGIKTNGQPYFGVGCPQQVKDYIDEQINKILGTNDITTTIDSLKEIEAFLKDFTNSDTLKKLLDLKANVDEVRATTDDIYKKSNPNDSDGNVVDTNTIVSVEDNPEYIKVLTDSVGKLIEAIGLDGVRKFFAGINIQGVSQCVTDNSEYISVELDKLGHILGGWEKDGNFVFGKIPIQFMEVTEKMISPFVSDIDLLKSKIINDNVVKQLKSATWNSVPTGLKLLHFSDIHGDGINLKRITDFAEKYSSLLDDVLFTGDMVNYQWSDGIKFWTDNNNTKKILVARGNHDGNDTANSWWYGKTTEECYDRYLSNNISLWNVEQPRDNNGVIKKVCYYYKDYVTYKIRLIVIDGMSWNAKHNDDAQNIWFNATLNDAKNKEYSVIIASHFFAAKGTPNRNINLDAFYDNTSWIDNDTTSGAGYGYLHPDVSKNIDNFIVDGGKFICYLGGHTHADFFRLLTEYPNQLEVNVANASMNENVGKNAECYIQRHKDTVSQDLFNIVNVIPTFGILEIIRVGCDFDTIGRHIGTLTYDYINKKVISQY